MRAGTTRIPIPVLLLTCCLVSTLPATCFHSAPAERPDSSPWAGGALRMGAATAANAASGGGLGASSARPSTSGNSTPVPEVGTIVGNLSGGTDPWGGFYEPVEGMVYATDFGDSRVDLLQGLQSRGFLGVGMEPIAGAYDPADGLDYISNYLSNNLSLYHGTTSQGSIAVRPGPWGITYDPADQEVYVANYGAANVTVLQGRTVVAMIPVGNQPEGIVCDTANGFVYVVNHGSDNVTVLDGRTVIANLAVGHDPEGAAYDASNGEVYVTNNYNGTVTALQGKSVVGTIRVGTAPASLAYDPSNGLVYVGNEGSGNLSVLKSNSVLVSIPTGTCPYAVVYDASNGAIYAMNCNPGTVYVISTVLGEAPITITPLGDPVNSTDVGEPVAVTGNVWAVGTGDAASFPAVSPNVGLACSIMNFSVNAYAWANSSTNCNATIPGNYTVWVNVTDSLGSSVSAWFDLRVFAGAMVSVPSAHSLGGGRIGSSDVGQTVEFLTNASGGTGNYAGWRWFGFPSGDCQALDSPSPTCVFRVPELLSVQSGVVDSNGKLTTSAPFGFQVYALPQVVSITPAVARADVGQSLNLTASTTEGAGGAVYSWNGAPSGCTALNTTEARCRFLAAGGFNLTVEVTDRNGGTSEPGPSAQLQISPDPRISAPVLSAPSVRVGAAENISVAVSGGVRPFLYDWSGLPSGCVGWSSPFTCTVGSPGTYRIAVVVTDANDFSVTSNASTLVVSANPSNHTSGGAPPPRFLGLAETSWIELSLGILVAGLVTGGVLRQRRRSRQRRQEGARDEPGPGF